MIFHRPIFTVLLILVISKSACLYAQQNILYKELTRKISDKQAFQEVDLFSRTSTLTAGPVGQDQLKSGSSFVSLQLNMREVHHLLSEKLNFIHVDVMTPDRKSLSLYLERQEVFGEESRILDSDHKIIGETSGGVYYRGVAIGLPQSLVALSIFEDQLIGVISLPVTGNLVLGKAKSGSSTELSLNAHVLFYERDLIAKMPFSCGTEEIPQLNGEQQLSVQGISQLPVYDVRCRKVKVHLECDYKLYQDQARSVNQVKNYMTGLFNVVKTLYYNEYIQIEISDILVWTNQDPYLHTTLANIIYHYAGYRKDNFTGNITQLISTFQPQQPGGIAFVGTICQNYNGQSGPHSFAFIYNTYSNFPTYSWSVYVMAHEMGHNYGSWHTHSCVWGVNKNSQLDNCQPPDLGSCASGPAPTGGGTIMSYCHLTSYGINFSKGFGKEPGDLLRNSVSTRSCFEDLVSPQTNRTTLSKVWEGDNLYLNAAPKLVSYLYDWFHYDYPIPGEDSSSLKINYSGVYKLAMSNRCTNFSKSDSITIADFQVNLGCPVRKGKRDSVISTLTMNADDAESKDSLVFPANAFNAIPAAALDILVVLRTKIAPIGSSWTQSVTMAYNAPIGTNVSNTNYYPNEFEQYYFSGVKTYTRILGRFDPKGKWVFFARDLRPEVGIDAKVTQEIILTWRMPDTVEVCDIPLCEGQPRTFDAGITGAQYRWSTGDTTQQISTKTQGPLAVTVTKNGRTSSHQIHVTTKTIHYDNPRVICANEKVKVGNHEYNQGGIYIDTLLDRDNCDSIITTRLTVKPVYHTFDSLELCYGDLFMSQPLYNDTTVNSSFTSDQNCDSLHTTFIHVNAEIKGSASVQIACDDEGASVNYSLSGGSGGFTFLWPDGFDQAHRTQVHSGTYLIEVVDAAACTWLDTLKVANYDSIGIAALIQDIKCAGKNDGRIELIPVSGTQPFFINWSNGNNALVNDSLGLGKYTVYISDQNGCKYENIFEIRSPGYIFIDVQTTPSQGNDGSAKASVSGGVPPYKYLWSTQDTTDKISGLAPGDYSVSIIDANGCPGIYFFSINRSTGIENVQDHKVMIYPNPASSLIFIKGWNVKPTSVAIYSSLGKKVAEFKQLEISDKSQALELPLVNIAGGIYIIEILEGNSKIIRKLVIDKS
ncbi:MAG: T9SS type A sorting domain-containing protein [Saprospiraceae bacterium]|jgi:hypothetical protein|nr:T9SS type A sorting domain-containing protein [Saprospiraceae bacterium]